MFFDPYFHFIHIWGSFVGFTSMPNRQFTYDQMFLSQDDLAIAALPSPPNPNITRNPSFAKQGSTLMVHYPPSGFFSSSCPLAPRKDIPEMCEDRRCESDPVHGLMTRCQNMHHCEYALNPGPLVGGPSAMDSVGYLVALSFVYLLLAGCWATLSSYGSTKSGWFLSFLLPRYWRKETLEYTGLPADGDDEDSGGVIVENVQKSYGSLQVLRGVSFRMIPGHVTALVGHNGAGKTTLSNILCCDTPLTSGNIRVFGQSVVNNPSHVRKMVGICRQDDYLWPDLTGKEHLKLFAGLRGVDLTSLDRTIQQWLVSVDLDKVQNEYSSGYSGGMKRRLSVALATIGDPPLIVLDEVSQSDDDMLNPDALPYPTLIYPLTRLIFSRRPGWTQ